MLAGSTRRWLASGPAPTPGAWHAARRLGDDYTSPGLQTLPVPVEQRSGKEPRQRDRNEDQIDRVPPESRIR